MPGELRRQLRELLLQVAAFIRDRSKEQDHSVASQIVEYVHEHHRLDISLTDMAEYFNLSPNYISQLIKEKTGKIFKEYLSEFRVKQAKRIMNEQGELKIHDVACLVGWRNVNTFIRVFKKYEGVTPGQYKQEMEREEGEVEAARGVGALAELERPHGKGRTGWGDLKWPSGAHRSSWR
jgi:YesN/AraC family two-component response regulator